MPQTSLSKVGRKGKTFLVKMIFYYHEIKTHFHKKGFALGLVLRLGVFGTPTAETALMKELISD